MNPALAGYIDGEHRVSILHRSQWVGDGDAGYQTSSVSYDRSFLVEPKLFNSFGIGGGMLSDISSDGAFSRQSIFASGAIHKSLSKDQFLSFGMQFRYFFSSIDLNELTFENQFNGVNGFDRSLPIGEEFENANNSNFDIQAGLLFSNYFSDQARIKVGVSFFNLTRPDASFSSYSGNLPILFQFHGVGDFLFNNDAFSVHPHFILMRQGKQSMFNAGAFLGSKLNETLKMYAGGALTNPNGMVITMGGEYKNIRSFLSYDARFEDTNFSRLSSIEIHLGYVFNSKKRDVSLKYF